MTLADTSAWIELVRGSQTGLVAQFEHLISSRSVAVTEPVRMEVLAGARDDSHSRRLANMLAWARPVAVEGLADWESAAIVYRACRRAGFTPRSQLDCLIAAVAIREDVPVLHANRDFDLIAQYTPLRVVPV